MSEIVDGGRAGVSGPGRKRVVVGQGGEMFATAGAE